VFGGFRSLIWRLPLSSYAKPTRLWHPRQAHTAVASVQRIPATLANASAAPSSSTMIPIVLRKLVRRRLLRASASASASAARISRSRSACVG